MIWDIKKIWSNFWSMKDGNKSNVINSMFFGIDKILYKTISSHASNPPDDPVEGDIYRIIPTGTDRFAGLEGYLAYYYNGCLKIIEPLEGMYFFDKVIGRFIYYNGSEWVANIECYADHNLLHNYDSFEHIDWSEPGPVKIDKERMLAKDIKSLSACGGLNHDELIGYIPEEHIDWTEPGEEMVDIERLVGDVGEGIVRINNDKLYVDIESSIADADGTLSDLTTKFNTLLSYLRNLKIIES